MIINRLNDEKNRSGVIERYYNYLNYNYLLYYKGTGISSKT